MLLDALASRQKRTGEVVDTETLRLIRAAEGERFIRGGFSRGDPDDEA